MARTWPSSIGDSVAELGQAWFGLSKLEEALSMAADTGSWDNTMVQYNKAGADPTMSGLSSVIRASLGLPNNGADYIATLDC